MLYTQKCPDVHRLFLKFIFSFNTLYSESNSFFCSLVITSLLLVKLIVHVILTFDMLSSISDCSDDLLVLVIDSIVDGVVDCLTSTRELEKVVDSMIVLSDLVVFLDGTNSRLPTFELSAEPFIFSSNSHRPLLLFVTILFSVFSSVG